MSLCSLANPIFDDLNVHLIQTPSTKLFILEECLVVYGYSYKKKNGKLNTISHPKYIFHAFFGGFPASLGLSLVQTGFGHGQVRISATVLYVQNVCLVMWCLHYLKNNFSDLQKFCL